LMGWQVAKSRTSVALCDSAAVASRRQECQCELDSSTKMKKNLQIVCADRFVIYTMLPQVETTMIAPTVSSSSRTSDESFRTMLLNVFKRESVDSRELLVTFVALDRAMSTLYIRR